MLSKAECEATLVRLYELEAADYEDAWVDELGLDRNAVALTKQSSSGDLQGADFQTRLNGLPKIDPTGAFDPMIAHPRVLPFLEAFMAEPQLVNICQYQAILVLSFWTPKCPRNGRPMDPKLTLMYPISTQAIYRLLVSSDPVHSVLTDCV